MRGYTRALLVLALIGVSASAQELVTEVLPAGFRSAPELVEILRPLVPAPGSVNAFENQIVVRTSPANLEELRRILASLDRPPANLLITVRHTQDEEVRRDLAEAALHLRAAGASGAPGGLQGSAGVRVQRSTVTRQGNDVQQLRVLEGREAFVRTGESVPVGERSVTVTGAGVAVIEGVRYEEFGSGFHVRPRLNGEIVTLQIVPARRELRGDGSASVQEAATTVTGVLGRWMEIAAVDTRRSQSDAGFASTRRTTTRRSDAVYVKVERLD